MIQTETHRRVQLALAGILFLSLTGVVDAQRRTPPERREQQVDRDRPGAPIPAPRRQGRDRGRNNPPTPGRPGRSEDTVLPDEHRRLDGMMNNLAQPAMGSAGQIFRRLITADYNDSSNTPSGDGRPNPRTISNALCAQTEDLPNSRGATDYLWQWGQFLDHDIDETPASDPAEPFNITVPTGDLWFDPQGTGQMIIPLNRSHGEEVEGVREQVNEITAFIDASNVYGSDEERAFALRTLDGSGRLKTTETDHGDLLPYNLTGLANAPADSPNFFLAGDVRANEQAGLAAMHTLFVREHNYWADRYKAMNPIATGEETYQFARMIVGAEMQVITYREFLPVLLGPNALPRYRGYNPNLDPSISNVFATAAYRLGHSLLSSTLPRIDADGNEVPEGHLSLADAFFNPAHLEDHGIESILRGLASRRCQELDGQLVNEVRNFLFGPPGAGGFDLGALNLQRGRDHGLPSFNDACRDLGLRPAQRFTDINADPDLSQAMAGVYQDVELVDCWIGGLCEPHVEGGMVGPMIRHILVDQFTRLRDGDRFWYQNHLSPELISLVEAQSLADVIRRNTEIGEEVSDNVFLVSDAEQPGRAQSSPRRPTRSNRRTRSRR